MREVEKLSGYYEMPMAIVVGIVATVMTVVVCVIVAMAIAVLMVVVVMTVLSLFPVRRASFDVDMGNVVLRMAVPQGVAKP